MGWVNPFGFKGRMGRVQAWLTFLVLIFLDLYTSVIMPIPVVRHDVIMSKYGGGGEASFSYFTPIEPIIASSWIYWVLACALVGVTMWLYAAVFLQRLNDLAISRNWFGVVLVLLLIANLIEAFFGRPDGPFSIADAASMVFLLPACAIGAFGMFMVMLVGGYVSRHDRMAKDDLRRTAA